MYPPVIKRGNEPFPISRWFSHWKTPFTWDFTLPRLIPGSCDDFLMPVEFPTSHVWSPKRMWLYVRVTWIPAHVKPEMGKMMDPYGLLIKLWEGWNSCDWLNLWLCSEDCFVVLVPTYPNQLKTPEKKQQNMSWGFPKLGVPPVHIHFHRVFHDKPASLGYPHDLGKLHLDSSEALQPGSSVRRRSSPNLSSF